MIPFKPEPQPEYVPLLALSVDARMQAHESAAIARSLSVLAELDLELERLYPTSKTKGSTK